MSFVVSCFSVLLSLSLQLTQPSHGQNLPCPGWPGPCNLVGRASPPRPPALRPPLSAAWGAPCRAVPSGEPPPRQRPRASSGVRAACGAAACRRRHLVPPTLEPVVGRPRRPLSVFLSFGGLHKGCDSAGECGTELQRPSALAVITPVLRRSGQACSCGRLDLQLLVRWPCFVVLVRLLLITRVDQHLHETPPSAGLGEGGETVFRAVSLVATRPCS